MININDYEPQGDKQNSDYFNEYLLKIYERRQSSGLSELLSDIQAIVIQVQTGDAFEYLKELYWMMPYRYESSYITQTHRMYILKNKKKTPILIVIEPLDSKYVDDITRVNRMYPNAREKFNARYVGEIFKCQSLHDVVDILKSHDFNFHDETTENELYRHKHLKFTRMSDLTYNSVGYAEHSLLDTEFFEFGQPFNLTSSQLDTLKTIDHLSKKVGIKKLMKGIDHMATRILAGEREDALLEYLCLSPYYFWGAYNIGDMNSSTNVTRVIHGQDICSPAKVFTANNTPFMVNSFEKLPMPTENFVRNYGRRMHHIAIEIKDGDYNKEMKNLDYVVNTLKEQEHIQFLAKVFGACNDEPDLKQIFSKHSQYSLLITEYVERCHQFDGFFTKDNVAALTEAAGLDEVVHHHQIHKGIIGD